MTMNITNKPLRIRATEKTAPTTELVHITPAMAREMLSRNTANRPIRNTHVDGLREAIKNGRWRLTHQGIGFASDGTLLDGQHRLMAIAMSETTVPCLVTTGLDPVGREAMDVHIRRTMGDRITLVEDDQRLNDAVCRTLRAYALITKGGGRDSASKNPEFYKQAYGLYGPSLEWAAEKLVMKHKRLGRNDIAAAMFGFHHKMPTEAEEFATRFLTGSSLEAGSPVLQAREMFLAGALRSGAHASEYYWKLVRAQQLFVEGKQAGSLFQATEDWLGNENRPVMKARAERGEKSARTKGFNLRSGK